MRTTKEVEWGKMIPLKLTTLLALALFPFSGARAGGLYDIGAEGPDTPGPKWAEGIDAVYSDQVSGSGMSVPDGADGAESFSSLSGKPAGYWLLSHLHLMGREQRLETVRTFLETGGLPVRFTVPSQGQVETQSSLWVTSAEGVNSSGGQTPAFSFVLVAVPEPSFALLAGFGGLALLRRRRSAE